MFTIKSRLFLLCVLILAVHVVLAREYSGVRGQHNQQIEEYDDEWEDLESLGFPLVERMLKGDNQDMGRKGDGMKSAAKGDGMKGGQKGGGGGFKGVKGAGGGGFKKGFLKGGFFKGGKKGKGRERQNVTCAATEPEIMCGLNHRSNYTGLLVCRTKYSRRRGGDSDDSDDDMMEMTNYTTCTPPTLGRVNDTCGCCEADCSFEAVCPCPCMISSRRGREYGPGVLVNRTSRSGRNITHCVSQEFAITLQFAPRPYSCLPASECPLLPPMEPMEPMAP